MQQDLNHKRKHLGIQAVIQYIIGFCSLPFFLTQNVPSRGWYNSRKSSALNPLMPEATTLTEKTYERDLAAGVGRDWMTRS